MAWSPMYAISGRQARSAGGDHGSEGTCGLRCAFVVHSDGPQPQAPVATPDRWRKDGADKGPQDVNGLQAMAT